LLLHYEVKQITEIKHFIQLLEKLKN